MPAAPAVLTGMPAAPAVLTGMPAAPAVLTGMPAAPLDHFELRQRQDELAASVAKGALLGEDLVAVVPREQQRVIGAVLVKVIGADDGDAHARAVETLLGGRGVGEVRDAVGAE